MVHRSHVSPQDGSNKLSSTNTPPTWKETSNEPRQHDRAPPSMFKRPLPYRRASKAQRALAAKLRLMRATGRIVLDIAPGSTGVANIPDLPLEDGDSFVVPPRPSNVKVVGAVYDQNAFIFENSRKAEDYLQLAGGIARSGDSRHTFIIRADGSVVSRKSKAARGGLERLSMNPGDTVVVPEIVDKTTLLRGLTDWSAIFGQFALGAAAINVLH